MGKFFYKGRAFSSGCSCGAHSDQASHDRDIGSEAHLRDVTEQALLKAVFPHAMERRTLLSTIGKATALAAIGSLLPIDRATEAFAQAGSLEKTNVKIGFIPITCATPIIMAEPMGFYEKQGLKAEVVKTAGWAVVRDKTMNKEYDAAHMLAPMPIALTLGIGSDPSPFVVPAIENVNGQAICLALKHKDNRDPKNWKGFRFAIPFEFSNHNYLLRYYLAEHGIDPQTDVELRVIAPPDMVANLRAGNIDGFLAPDNVVQRAVYDKIGFIHILSKEIWNGHPCCSFSLSKSTISDMPNTSAAMMRAILDATAYASKAENRKEIAAAIAPANYLNQPPTVVEQVLTGVYADGLGNVIKDPDRVTFDPFPWESFAVWTLTQMKRWGQIKGDIDYQAIAKSVYLETDAAKLMKDQGMAPMSDAAKGFTVMGKAFDPSKPEEYVASFAIKTLN
ncbi:CmpA/NrtA family ABC transporter substrate-binding protein [Rhizobium sp. SL86]|uniref:CmpA/NrtA family ABC transporter substrate-binding protein n=1 Tax=Rhizobium sp. SL86 TaxID=2995148 RepID=UPI002273F6E4|nr:CmpA/NrtA family ABC transporter substrate-binding protein [Rhizobium sp. SL86]MCY1667806.1 CmpA/NrtA family ABC transporter substrate-binding protein [Rhizobium sp. SL86]